MSHQKLIAISRLRIIATLISRFLINQKFHIIQIDMIYGKLESEKELFVIDEELFLL